ncbi:hypothetical protein DENSPDRAFT_558715 [Dentipellis sp. KUC8613]|nr:hypothetical protein DENSPDRAFT_558715 [Dentipellis sp. KUC8613]
MHHSAMICLSGRAMYSIQLSSSNHGQTVRGDASSLTAPRTATGFISHGHQHNPAAARKQGRSSGDFITAPLQNPVDTPAEDDAGSAHRDQPRRSCFAQDGAGGAAATALHSPHPRKARYDAACGSPDLLAGASARAMGPICQAWHDTGTGTRAIASASASSMLIVMAGNCNLTTGSGVDGLATRDW